MRAFLRHGILLCLILAAPAAVAAPPSAPPDLQKTFPEIRRQLASAEFAQREAGQKLLDALLPSQLDALRALAKVETDAEVKARLDNRIEDLELHILTHPPAVSLHVRNATLSEVARQLAEQLGDDVQITSSVLRRGIAAPVGKEPTFTLQADNLPFWDLFLRLQRQVPLTISSSTSVSGAGTKYVLRLTEVASVTNPSHIVDSFLVTPQITGSAAGTWTLRLSFNADPRVRITQYTSRLRIARITDQDGKSVLPSVTTTSSSMSNLVRPTSAWTSTATLSAVPDLKTIKELRAAVDLAILEKETSLMIDLAKPMVPIETTRGTLTVDRNAGGNLTIRFATPPPAEVQGGINIVKMAGGTTSSRAPYTSVRILDEKGTALSTTYTSSNQITIGGKAANVGVKVEIIWPESARTMTLPLELHDLPVPPPPAPNPAVNPLPVDRWLVD